jgi:hypothetical protein
MSATQRRAMTARDLVLRLSSKAKWILGLVVLIVGVATAVLIRLPAWVLVLLGPLALAALYILARMQSRYDPLDPRFGSCIPPINMPRSNHSNSGIPPSALPYTDAQQPEG